MLDFTPVFKKEITMNQLCADLTPDDLRALTNEMIDTMLNLIAECADEDITFAPEAPDAEDNQGWPLAQNIVHTTATAESAAATAAELARGVPSDGERRSRYEVPGETLTTIEQCRQRLEESRRMRLASLDMWPDAPHLDNSVELRFLEGPVNAVAYFATGLLHDGMHVSQITETVRQAKAARL